MSIFFFWRTMSYLFSGCWYLCLFSLISFIPQGGSSWETQVRYYCARGVLSFYFTISLRCVRLFVRASSIFRRNMGCWLLYLNLVLMWCRCFLHTQLSSLSVFKNAPLRSFIFSNLRQIFLSFFYPSLGVWLLLHSSQLARLALFFFFILLGWTLPLGAVRGSQTSSVGSENTTLPPASSVSSRLYPNSAYAGMLYNFWFLKKKDKGLSKPLAGFFDSYLPTRYTSGAEAFFFLERQTLQARVEGLWPQPLTPWKDLSDFFCYNTYYFRALPAPKDRSNASFLKNLLYLFYLPEAQALLNGKVSSTDSAVLVEFFTSARMKLAPPYEERTPTGLLAADTMALQLFEGAASSYFSGLQGLSLTPFRGSLVGLTPKCTSLSFFFYKKFKAPRVWPNVSFFDQSFWLAQRLGLEVTSNCSPFSKEPLSHECIQLRAHLQWARSAHVLTHPLPTLSVASWYPLQLQAKTRPSGYCLSTQPPLGPVSYSKSLLPPRVSLILPSLVSPEEGFSFFLGPRLSHVNGLTRRSATLLPLEVGPRLTCLSFFSSEVTRSSLNYQFVANCVAPTFWYSNPRSSGFCSSSGEVRFNRYYGWTRPGHWPRPSYAAQTQLGIPSTFFFYQREPTIRFFMLSQRKNFKLTRVTCFHTHSGRVWKFVKLRRQPCVLFRQPPTLSFHEELRQRCYAPQGRGAWRPRLRFSLYTVFFFRLSWGTVAIPYGKLCSLTRAAKAFLIFPRQKGQGRAGSKYKLIACDSFFNRRKMPTQVVSVLLTKKQLRSSFAGRNFFHFLPTLVAPKPAIDPDSLRLRGGLLPLFVPRMREPMYITRGRGVRNFSLSPDRSQQLQGAFLALWRVRWLGYACIMTLLVFTLLLLFYFTPLRLSNPRALLVQLFPELTDVLNLLSVFFSFPPRGYGSFLPSLGTLVETLSLFFDLIFVQAWVCFIFFLETLGWVLFLFFSAWNFSDWEEVGLLFTQSTCVGLSYVGWLLYYMFNVSPLCPLVESLVSYLTLFFWYLCSQYAPSLGSLFVDSIFQSLGSFFTWSGVVFLGFYGMLCALDAFLEYWYAWQAPTFSFSLSKLKPKFSFYSWFKTLPLNLLTGKTPQYRSSLQTQAVTTARELAPIYSFVRPLRPRAPLAYLPPLSKCGSLFSSSTPLRGASLSKVLWPTVGQQNYSFAGWPRRTLLPSSYLRSCVVAHIPYPRTNLLGYISCQSRVHSSLVDLRRPLFITGLGTCLQNSTAQVRPVWVTKRGAFFPDAFVSGSGVPPVTHGSTHRYWWRFYQERPRPEAPAAWQQASAQTYLLVESGLSSLRPWHFPRHLRSLSPGRDVSRNERVYFPWDTSRLPARLYGVSRWVDSTIRQELHLFSSASGYRFTLKSPNYKKHTLSTYLPLRLTAPYVVSSLKFKPRLETWVSPENLSLTRVGGVYTSSKPPFLSSKLLPTYVTYSSGTTQTTLALSERPYTNHCFFLQGRAPLFTYSVPAVGYLRQLSLRPSYLDFSHQSLFFYIRDTLVRSYLLNTELALPPYYVGDNLTETLLGSQVGSPQEGYRGPDFSEFALRERVYLLCSSPVDLLGYKEASWVSGVAPKTPGKSELHAQLIPFNDQVSALPGPDPTPLWAADRGNPNFDPLEFFYDLPTPRVVDNYRVHLARLCRLDKERHPKLLARKRRDQLTHVTTQAGVTLTPERRSSITAAQLRARTAGLHSASSLWYRRSLTIQNQTESFLTVPSETSPRFHGLFSQRKRQYAAWVGTHGFAKSTGPFRTFYGKRRE